MHRFNQKKYASLLSYIPGLIVLVFSMFALHCSIKLIEMRASVRDQHYERIEKLIDFQNVFYTFEMSYDELIINNQKPDFKEIRQNIGDLNDKWEGVKETINLKGHMGGVSLEHLSYAIQSGLGEIVYGVDRNQNKIETGGEPLERDILREKIEETYEAVLKLESIIFQEYREVVFSDDIQERELWLYWSVIALGLAGFILIVLNSNRLQEVRKSNEERIIALDNLEKRLAALELAKDGILIIKAHGEVMYFNKAMASLLNIEETERETYFNQKWQSIFSQKDIKKLDNSILPQLRKDRHWIGEFRITRDDDDEAFIDTEISGTLLLDGVFVGTFQDMSEQHKAEKEKKSLEDQFYQAQKMEAIGRLAGGIAHDFNNILAAMNGYAEFLMDDLEEGTEQYNFARNIYLAGSQAKELVDQVLTFSRRSSSLQESMDIVPVINEIITMIKATMPKTIEMVCRVEPSMAPVFGNATQLSQVMMNLCVNAIDAMAGEHGTLEIELAHMETDEINISGVCQEEMPDPKSAPHLSLVEIDSARTRLVLGHVQRDVPYIRVGIIDSGCGMSKVIMERVFEPFFTTKSVDEGTGLGLATVHGVIVSHRAMMIIDSVIGKGTRFDVYIPISEAEEKPLSATEGIFMDAELFDEDDPLCILVVEDQESVAEITIKMLERMGFEAYSAMNGLQALEIVRENPDAFDLILTDYNMPKMTGLELAQQVYLENPDLPIILLSGYNTEKIKKLIVDNPSVKAIIRKPVSRKILEENIRSVISAAPQPTSHTTRQAKG